MGTIRLFKVWLLIGLIVLSGASLSYAQFSDCGVNTCTNDNVGIGTTSPGTTLTVNSNSSSTAEDSVRYPLILHMSEAGATGDGVGIAFTRSGSQLAYVEAIRTSDTDESSSLRFRTQTAGGLHPERVRIDSAGNVGIGTTGPETKLHITGNGGNISSDISNGNLIQLDG